jgi:lipopolysaccharide transport system ATP-binding protein
MRTCAVIFVSHSMQTIARICTHGMLMEKGNIKLYTNNMQEAIEFYFDAFQGEGATIEFNEFAEIEEIKINGEIQIDEKHVFQTRFGKDLVLNLKVKIKSNHTRFCVKMQITDKDMKMVAQSVSNKFHHMFENQGDNEIQFTFPKLALIDGEYSLTYFIQFENDTKPYNGQILATYRNYTKFKVKGLEEVLYAPVYLIPEIEHNNQKLQSK